jgi:hypothetical protein
VVVVDIAANADAADSPTRVSINDDKAQSR